MIPLRETARLLRITRVFVRHDLDEFVHQLHLFRPYRWLLRAMPWRWFRGASRPRAVRLREALEELGPVFVKFGQALSTRPDLLPEDIAIELARLQDRVPPFAGDDAVGVVERALGAPVDRLFSDFDRMPVASASVAQVHFATLPDGTPVAVKVMRPGISAVIERDLALLRVLARLALHYWAGAAQFRPLDVVEEYARTIRDELDLQREAANASQLRANFEGSTLLYVPRVYWDLTRADVMVMERIHGIPVSQTAALRAANIDLRQLAHNGVEIFFTQAFRDGFFHADMHPGNIFVSPSGQYCAVDFGIMGTLSEADKHYLAENFLGFFNRDYRAVAEAHVRAGWVTQDIRIEEFEAAIRAVCEPIFAKPLKDISFGRLLLRLFQTARRFGVTVQPQLLLLQKTLFNIEGLGRQLYPDLDLWETAKPFLEKWMREQFGPRAFLRILRREFPRWWRMLPEAPALVHDFLRRAGEGELSMEWKSQELAAMREELRRHQQRQALAVSGGSLVLAGAVLTLAPALPVVAAGVAIVGATLLLVAWRLPAIR